MLEEVGWKKPSETFLFNIFEKKENGNGDERTKGFGQDVWKRDRISSRRERGEKKEFLPLRFRKRISEVGCTQTRLYVCGGCANHYFSANVLSVFFFFVDSCWKGEFLSWLALTSTREAEAAFRATSYPVGGAINEHERERDGRVADREREREREIKINAGERIIRPL